MAGSLPPDKKIRTNPDWLSEYERAYYRTTWGFDPLADITYLGDGCRRLEIFFPLLQDPSLETIGVTIGARVDWFVGEIRNRIVFRRGDREAEVECTHTVVYAGPVSNALAYASDEITRQNLLSEEGQELINRAGGTISLPPWEHFAALKSYVSAIAEIGIFTLFRQQIKAPIETGEEIPFGFNAEMQHQVIRAIQTIAPKVIDQVLQDLTRELLENVPPEWIITRWEILRRLYPIESTFTRDPQIFSDWLRSWQKDARDSAVLPEITQILEKNIDTGWNEWLHTWDTEEIINLFRFHSLSDALQDCIFSDIKNVNALQTKAPMVLWTHLFLEWKARRAAKNYALDFAKFKDDFVEKWSDFPAAEVWPRGPLYAFDFPTKLLRHALEARKDPTTRQERLEHYLRESAEHYAKDDDMEFMVDWAKEFRELLPENLDKELPTSLDRSGISPSMKVEKAQELIQQGNAHQRRNVALICDLPSQLQEELVKHWDFATRLALAINPKATRDTLNQLKKDIQPSVNAVAEARLDRNESSILPLIGEILSPGEILWLLASHPRKFFMLGATTWGDGSLAYRDWFQAQSHRDLKWKNAIGELCVLAYMDGIICEIQLYSEGEYTAMHLVLDGLIKTTIGHFPCIYLGIENLGISISLPDFSIASEPINNEKRRDPSYFS